MLSALGNGVKGNKWFSLMDKAERLTTLAAAWRKVPSNGGAPRGCAGFCVNGFRLSQRHPFFKLDGEAVMRLNINIKARRRPQ